MNPLIPKFYRTLLSTQAAPRRRIRAYQRHLLERLVRHARATVPFYRDTGRLDPLFEKDGSIRLSNWNNVPILSRRLAYENREALTAERLPIEMLPLESDCTSGSTGQPLPFQRTELSRIASVALLARVFHWHDAAAVGRLAFFESERRSRLRLQSNLADEAASFSAPASISSGASPAEQVDRMRALRPTHIVGRSNLLLALAEASSAPFEGVRLVVQSGEVLRPEARAAIAAGFQAKVVDVYSSSELGPIAMEGPQGLLRVSEESVYLEWPAQEDDQAHPVVVTPFYGYAMPLIRYAQGDYARFSHRADADAPALRQLESIVGRERNLFRRPDGSRFSPELSGWTMHSIIKLRRWRLIQVSPTDAVLEVVHDEPPSPTELANLKDYVSKAIDPIAVRIAPVDAIVDDRASGKSFECYRSLVP